MVVSVNYVFTPLHSSLAWIIDIISFPVFMSLDCVTVFSYFCNAHYSDLYFRSFASAISLVYIFVLFAMFFNCVTFILAFAWSMLPFFCSVHYPALCIHSLLSYIVIILLQGPLYCSILSLFWDNAVAYIHFHALHCALAWIIGIFEFRMIKNGFCHYNEVNYDRRTLFITLVLFSVEAPACRNAMYGWNLLVVTLILFPCSQVIWELTS